MKTFEQYLQDIHAENYNGTDDDMPEAFEAWVTELQADEMITYAQYFSDLRYQEGRIDATKDALEIVMK